jgi:steroid delta-isomerase-like uncharacterized protein
MSEENKRISRRIAEEAFAQGKVEVLDELVDENLVDNSPGLPDLPPGREGLKSLARAYHEAFPDMEIRIEEQIAEGDKVVTRWSASGTHQGDFMGIPATGRQGGATGITIDRIQNGKVVETVTNWDILGLLQQLGAIPEPAKAS